MKIDVNYLDSNTWVEQDMRERFRWLRENDPVYWSEKDEIWVITKMAIRAANELGDHATGTVVLTLPLG